MEATMARDDAYFQFPLCLLSMPGDWQAVMNSIIEHSIISYGFKVGIIESANLRMTPLSEGKAILGKLHEKLDFSGGEFETIVTNYELAGKHLVRFRSATPANESKALVRLRTDICWDARNGHLSRRLFCILAAVYSALGDLPMKKITRQEIQRRAAGIVSKVAFADPEVPRGELYTDKMIRLALDELEERNFFVSSVFNRRQRYFSNRLKIEQLREEIVKSKCRTHASRIARQQQDAEMTRRILSSAAGQ